MLPSKISVIFSRDSELRSSDRKFVREELISSACVKISESVVGFQIGKHYTSPETTELKMEDNLLSIVVALDVAPVFP